MDGTIERYVFFGDSKGEARLNYGNFRVMESEVLFPVFNLFLPSCLKYRPGKSLSRETCPDFELRIEKPVQEPVFPKTGCRAQLDRLLKGRTDRALCRILSESPPVDL